VIHRYKLEGDQITKVAQVLSSAELNGDSFVLTERMQSFYVNDNSDVFVVTNQYLNSSLAELNGLIFIK